LLKWIVQPQAAILAKSDGHQGAAASRGADGVDFEFRSRKIVDSGQPNLP
jgi:hypothetical protein